MTIKRKPTLKQVFNAWLKYQKKHSEAYMAKCFVEDLAKKAAFYTTELIEHEEKIYRVTIGGGGYGNPYKVEELARTIELPVKN